MKYQLGSHVLDTTARTLTKNDDVRPIRPKTLELLLYLAQRPDEIVSKETLLAELWSNVTVDEGVVFQSITEIRKLVSNPKIIITFPKRGYQLTQPLTPIENKAVRYTRPRIYAAFAVTILAVASIVFLALPLTGDNTATQSALYPHRIVVLPVNSHVAYTSSNWAGLNGVHSITSRLNGDDDVYVYSSYDIATLLQQTDVNNGTASLSPALISASTGASLVVETDVYGGVNNYNLVYKLHSNNSVTQGSVFDTSIDGAFSKLAQKIAESTATHFSSSPRDPISEFNDELFSKAIISYESDWKTSISYFETYLNLKPDSLIARLYLCRLYLWEGRFDDAQRIIDSAVVLENSDVRHRAQVAFLKGQLAAQRKAWQQAVVFFDEAISLLNESNDWSLQGDILQHHASVLEQQGEYLNAQLLLETAMTYYQRIASPIGINAIRLHLARVLYRQDKHASAKAYFEQAKNQIMSQQLVFLYSSLEQQSQFFAAKPPTLN